MFSSLASLLPSLHTNINADLPKQTVNPEESNKEDQENAYGVQTVQLAQTIPDQDQQNPSKGKEKDAKSLTEVCFFFYCYPIQSGGTKTRIVCMFSAVLYQSSFDPHERECIHLCRSSIHNESLALTRD